MARRSASPRQPRRPTPHLGRQLTAKENNHGISTRQRTRQRLGAGDHRPDAEPGTARLFAGERPAHTRMRPVTVSGAHRGGETVLAAKKGLRRAKAALPVMRPTAAPMGGMPGQGAMSNMPPEGPGGQPFPVSYTHL